MGTKRPKGGTKFGVRPCTKVKIKEKKQKRGGKRNERANGDYKANGTVIINPKEIIRVKDSNPFKKVPKKFS